MRKGWLAIPAAILLALVIAAQASAPAGGQAPAAAPLVIRVTTSRTCRLPRLPTWLSAPTTSQAFGLDSFFHDVYAPTYLNGSGIGLTTWQQQGWRVAVFHVVVSNAGPIEQALGSIHLPGRGAAFWTNPSHYVLSAVWCTGGRVYRVHLLGIPPHVGSMLLASVLAQWDKTHAARYACRAVQLAVRCQPAGSA